jgi:hypothetical protein
MYREDWFKVRQRYLGSSIATSKLLVGQEPDDLPHAVRLI